MSLFNRPAWASSSTSTSKPEATESNLFSHSGRSYANIVAESQRRKREKKEREEKKKARAEEHSPAKRSPVRRDVVDEPDALSVKKEGSIKRRRITAEDGAALLSSVGLSAEPAIVIDDADNESDGAVSPVKKILAKGRSPRFNRHVDAKQDVSNDHSDRRRDIRAESPTTAVDARENRARNGTNLEVPAQRVESLSSDDEDDEFADLKRRAREKRHQAQRDSNRSEDPNKSGSASAAPRHDDLPDPVISLLIHSSIPDTKPLVVQRKLSQRLQEVREAWCRRQGFSNEVSDTIFFIYRRRRQYDVTTCRSLGLEVDVFGNLTMKGEEGKEGVENVELEAVTDEIFKQRKEEWEREALRRSGQLSPEPDPDETGADDGAAENKETLVRIVLKAKDKEDFRLKVKPTTRFGRIMTAYSNERAQRRPVFLEFDGERLDPDDEVQQSEISDLDVVDVYVG